MNILPLDKRIAAEVVIEHHYLHRRPPIRYAFGLFQDEQLRGVITFGTPPSRHLQMSLCPSDPNIVIELNRLWVHDDMPRNTESWFVSRALRLIPTLLVVSYADTARGHVGYVYRASNFYYAGLTDQDRKTPRYDYVVEGKHSRDAFRGNEYKRVRRLPKHRYWTVSGGRRNRHKIEETSGWPKMDWKAA